MAGILLFSFTDEESREETRSLNKEQRKKSVLNCMRTTFNTFCEFVAAQHLIVAEVERLPETELNDFLMKFFTQLRKKNGAPYTRNSLFSMRYSLQLHFKEIRGIDIINDKPFEGLAEMFRNMPVWEETRSLNTRQQNKDVRNCMRTSFNAFCEFVAAQNLDVADIERIPETELNDLLVKFFGQLRKKNGAPYSLNSLFSIRYGLQLHFKNMRDTDIVNNRAFKGLTEVFMKIRAKVLSTNKKRPDVLSSADLRKLYSCGVLSVDSPQGLQNKVFVDIMLYLRRCCRDSLLLRDMKISDFEIGTDARGRFVAIRPSEINPEYKKSGRGILQKKMYECPGNDRCPVSSFEKYLSKLPKESQWFWQRANSKYDPELSPDWYLNLSLGHNTLQNKMVEISTTAKLSKIYTNRCLPATYISFLRQSRIHSRSTKLTGMQLEMTRTFLDVTFGSSSNAGALQEFAGL